MIKGIDVSEFQGNIDFKKVKEAGISFVIVRAGYGRHESQEDKCFKSNMDNALLNGLDVGAYWFSYATNIDEAKEEARLFASFMEPYKGRAKYPLYYDYEYASYDYSISKKVKPTAKLITDMAITFMEELSSLGWYSGYYTNLDYYYNRLETQRLKNYSLWLAQYSNNANVTCELQQYSNCGIINGIYGYTDLNKAHSNLPSKITGQSKNGFKKSGNFLEVTGNGVRIREKPSTLGEILAAVYIGDKVEFVSDMKNGWSEILYDNKKSYISNEYLKSATLSKYPLAKNFGNSVNVRAKPSLNAEVITQISGKVSFPVISKLSNGWIYTLIGKTYGYIFYDPSYINLKT